MTIRTFLGIFLIFVLISCQNDNYSDKLDRVLQKSTNKEELLKAIRFFENDSLKKKAVYFLIENMMNKGSVLYTENDKLGNVLNHDWGKHPTYTDALNSSKKNGIHIQKDTVFYDINSIKAEFLIQNINDAFETRKKPWNKNIDFENFLNYVLPYRDRSEELSDNWRNTVLKKYAWNDTLQEENNVLILKRANDSLKSNFKFNYNYTLSFPYPNFTRMDSLGEGTCPYMTSYTIYNMRGLGIPVTRDYVPYWTNIHHFSNHEWNSMLGTDGKWYGFMGCEANPPSYKPIFHAAKVFRETFAINDIALHKMYEKRSDIPAEFRRTDIIDVTHEYYPSGNITLTTPPSCINEKALFLAIYNQKRWRVVYWGLTNENQVTFKNMSKDVVYLLMRKEPNGAYVSVSNPFLYTNDGTTIDIIEDEKQTEIVSVHSFGLGYLGGKDFVNPLEEGKSYTLRYWKNNTWEKIESKTTIKENDTLHFSNIPKNALLSLGRDEKENNAGEQLFIFQNNTQAFY